MTKVNESLLVNYQLRFKLTPAPLRATVVWKKLVEQIFQMLWFRTFRRVSYLTQRHTIRNALDGLLDVQDEQQNFS